MHKAAVVWANQEWTQNEFKSIFFIQKKGKHKEVSNNKSQPQMIKLGYKMEVYIVTHDDGWGLVASNKRFLGQTKLVQYLQLYSKENASKGRKILIQHYS